MRNELLRLCFCALVGALLPLLAFSPSSASAEEGQGSAAPATAVTAQSTESELAPGPVALEPAQDVRLSLTDAIAIALSNNTDIRVLSYDPRIALLDITRQESQFDPTVSVGLSYTNNQPGPVSVTRLTRLDFNPVSTAVITSETESESTAYQASIAARNTLGGTLSVVTDTTKNDSGSTTLALGGGSRSVTVDKTNHYQGTAALSFSQPLLRNAGTTYNKAAIRVARNNADSTAYLFQDNVMNLVSSATTAYWQLVLARENIRVLQKSLEAAQDLLKNNTIKYEAGALPKVEVTRARARVAERDVAIVTGNAVIKNAEDQLRRILDSDKYALLGEAGILPEDAPSVYAYQLDLAESVQKALAMRPDVRQQVLTIESYGILVARSRNQLLPVVDLQATYRLNSFGDSWGENFDAASQLSDRNLTAGVVFAWPLGNRAARSDYTRTRYQRLQALASLKALERNVTLAVKKAIRDVATSLQEIDANRIRLDAAKENLDAEVQKYEVGQSISLDVLDAQDKLQQAASDYNLSLVGFNVAMSNYHRVIGDILVVNGIEVVQPSEVKIGARPSSN